MKTTLVTLSVLAALALGLTACGKEDAEEKNAVKTEPIPVRVMPLEQHLRAQHITGSGSFTTNDETPLSFKTGGIIKKIYVREGDAIRQGQLLASLNLTEIESLVRQARLGVEKADRDFQRVQNLYRDSVLSFETYQNAKTALELAKAQLESASFNMQQSEIRALTDGVVMRKLSNEGAVVGPGTPVFITNSKGSTNWVLRLAVSDESWMLIHLKDSAIVKAGSGVQRTFNGVVVAKAEAVDPYTGSLWVDIAVPQQQNLNVASGMYGSATVAVQAQDAMWEIPYDAVLDGDGGKGFVFVSNDNKTAHKVPVSIYAIKENMVQVSAGLSDAKALIVKGNAYLTEGSAIRISNN